MVKNMSSRTIETAEFLYNILEAGEVRSREVYRQAREAGFSIHTLHRVRGIIGLEPRYDDGRWYMYLTEDQRRRKEEIIKQLETHGAKSPLSESAPETMKISEDWVSILTTEDEAVESDIDEIPVHIASIGGLHIKAGAYEFTADASFPTEKLIEPLKGLGVEKIC